MEYNEILKRIAANPTEFCHGIACHDCPNGPARVCGTHCQDRLNTLQLDGFLSALEKWDKEPPQKTYMQDFFEKFPKAPREDDTSPRACWENIYDNGGPCTGFLEHRCLQCWNRPMPEEDTK